MTRLAIAAVLALGAPASPDELGLDGLNPGARLRIKVTRQEAFLVGTFVRAEEELLVLQDENRRISVPRGMIEGVEVSRPRFSRGLRVGVLAGAAAGLAAARQADWNEPTCALIGAAIGLPAGIAGAAVSGRRAAVLEGSLLGAALGAATLTALWATTGDSGDWARATLLLGGVAGAVSGGAAAARAGESWRPLPRRRLGLALVPVRGGVAASVQATF